MWPQRNKEPSWPAKLAKPNAVTSASNHHAGYANRYADARGSRSGRRYRPASDGTAWGFTRHHDPNPGGCAECQPWRSGSCRWTSQASVDHARNGSPSLGPRLSDARRREEVDQRSVEAPWKRGAGSGDSSLDAPRPRAKSAATRSATQTGRSSRRTTRRTRAITSRSIRKWRISKARAIKGIPRPCTTS